MLSSLPKCFRKVGLATKSPTTLAICTWLHQQVGNWSSYSAAMGLHAGRRRAIPGPSPLRPRVGVLLLDVIFCQLQHCYDLWFRVLGLVLAAGASARCWGFSSLLGLLLAAGASAVFVSFCCIRKSRSSGAFGASAAKPLSCVDLDILCFRCSMSVLFWFCMRFWRCFA